MISDFIHEDFRLDGRSFSSCKKLFEYIDDHYPQASGLIRSWAGDGKIEVKTSGSTGRPKTIVLNREQMRQSAVATGEFFNLKRGSNALLCLPLKYIAGKMMLVRAMTLGWNLSGVEPSVHLDIPENMMFDIAAMVPLQLENSRHRIQGIKNLIVGGAPVGKGLQRDIDALPTRIYASYGMTETVTHIALRPLNLSAGRMDEKEVYTGLPGIYFEVDSRGCLVIDCKRISEEKVVTNDLVEIIAENKFIWRGRVDSVINSGGLKLIPEEIERKFSECIQGRFFATGIPDDQLGESLVFLIEGAEEESLLGQLQSFQKRSQDSVIKQEVPRKLIFVSSFIETPSKKIDRRKTLDLLFQSDGK